MKRLIDLKGKVPTQRRKVNGNSNERLHRLEKDREVAKRRRDAIRVEDMTNTCEIRCERLQEPEEIDHLPISEASNSSTMQLEMAALSDSTAQSCGFIKW